MSEKLYHCLTKSCQKYARTAYRTKITILTDIETLLNLFSSLKMYIFPLAKVFLFETTYIKRYLEPTPLHVRQSSGTVTWKKRPAAVSQRANFQCAPRKQEINIESFFRMHELVKNFNLRYWNVQGFFIVK